MGMSRGIGGPGEIQGQIQAMEAQKSELEGNKQHLKEAISDLRGRKSEIEGNIEELEAKMNQQLPPEFKAQLAERVAMLKNARQQIEGQIKDFENKLAMMSEARENIKQAISARKSVLQQFAGVMAQKVAHLANREVGHPKG